MDKILEFLIPMKKTIKDILVTNLKKYRERLALTQEEAAEKAGITGKYWQRLEMRSQIDLPSLIVLFKIARCLETTPAKLLHRTRGYQKKQEY